MPQILRCSYCPRESPISEGSPVGGQVLSYRGGETIAVGDNLAVSVVRTSEPDDNTVELCLQCKSKIQRDFKVLLSELARSPVGVPEV